MGKLFGILIMVGAIWVGMEIYTVGTQQAFGGVFAWLGEPLNDLEPHDPGDDRTITRRMGDKVQSHILAGFEREEALIEADR